jgi:hypothetical protein
MNFDEWWMRVGRHIDPEPSVNWYDKRKDLMAAAFEAAKAQSGNYVCDDDTRPTKVTFANGRVVECVGNQSGVFLEVSRTEKTPWDELAECSPSTIAAVMDAPLPAPEPARKAVCGTCGGSGETEEDATGALGYVVKKPCPDCAGGR